MEPGIELFNERSKETPRVFCFFFPRIQASLIRSFQDYSSASPLAGELVIPCSPIVKIKEDPSGFLFFLSANSSKLDPLLSKTKPRWRGVFFDPFCGEGGIRTPGTLLAYGSLANYWFKPLTHLSGSCLISIRTKNYFNQLYRHPRRGPFGVTHLSN